MVLAEMVSYQVGRNECICHTYGPLSIIKVQMVPLLSPKLISGDIMALHVLLSRYDPAFIICYVSISFSIIFQSFGGGIAQSEQRLTTGWTV